MIATLKSYPNISAKCVFVCVCVCVCVFVFRNEKAREESMCGIHKSPADTKMYFLPILWCEVSTEVRQEE